MPVQDRIDPNVPGLDLALAFRDARLPGNAQAGAAYTAELADLEKIIRFTGADPAILTVPTNAAVPFPIGTVLTVAQDGAGAVTIAGAGGVSINLDAGKAASIAGPFSLANLRKTDTDTWSLFGGLADA